MKIFKNITDPELVAMIRRGAVGVLPTDTLYGIVASTSFPASIERLYEVRNRSSLKGCITLLAAADQARNMIVWNKSTRDAAKKYWPGPVSIILSVSDETPDYLHPIDNTLAFRVPDNKDLQSLLWLTGPLFAPSANMAGEKPAATIDEAKAYFGDTIDFYVDAGDLSGNKPSTLIRPSEHGIEVLRGSLPNV